MKDKIIKFIKQNPFLYNLAKKVNRKLNKIPPKQEYFSNIVYYIYILKEQDDLEKIKKHYKKVEENNSKLLIVIDNKDVATTIHKLIRENQNILFVDLNYFKYYQTKLQISKFIMLDYKEENLELLEYIKR